ncbi:hypothetical protein [Actinomadura mexicana]|uniref:Uncharacterized protein n=1 Tax=Actinomadura mexicana TaxID=134959 RepID=A0A239HIV9_9ACTN|nr:hypothetical protein [Actinomadura mexicana]SNS80988.1 hypothetical protein SAMN06265355_13141 [Actinomadura mexicana]
MTEPPASGAGDDGVTYEELLRQTGLIYRRLSRSGVMTKRQLTEAWDAVEAAIYVALDTTDDPSGRTVGRAALNAAREVQAKWLPDQSPGAGHTPFP